MITQELVVEKILAYLNDNLTEDDLIQWAENALVTHSESDTDILNEDTIFEALGYIGAGDTSDFPLTWTVLSGFLEQLGTKVRVVSDAA